MRKQQIAKVTKTCKEVDVSSVRLVSRTLYSLLRLIPPMNRWAIVRRPLRGLHPPATARLLTSAR